MNETSFDVIGQTGISRETLTRIGELAHCEENETADIPDAASTEAENANLKLLGKGSGRVVYRVPDGEYIVKFPIVTAFDDGVEQLRTELTILEGLPDAHMNRFVPYVASHDDYYWGVQPLAEPVTDENNSHGHEAAITAMLESFPYLRTGSEFLLESNLGWYDLSYRVFDYGSYVPRQFIEKELGSDYIEKIGVGRLA
jgi:hypothetical protein